MLARMLSTEWHRDVEKKTDAVPRTVERERAGGPRARAPQRGEGPCVSITVAAMAYSWSKRTGRLKQNPRPRPRPWDRSVTGTTPRKNDETPGRDGATARDPRGRPERCEATTSAACAPSGPSPRRGRRRATGPTPPVWTAKFTPSTRRHTHRTPRSRRRRRRRRRARQTARPPERRRRAARGPRARAGAGTRRRRPRAPPAPRTRAWRTCGGRGLGQRGGSVGVVANGPSRGIEPSRGSATRSRDPSAVQRRDSRRAVDAIDATRRRARTPPQNRGSANNAPAP